MHLRIIRFLMLSLITLAVSPSLADDVKISDDWEDKLREPDKTREAPPDEIGSKPTIGIADEPAPEDPIEVIGAMPFGDQDPKEIKTLEHLLNAEAWHYRCFGLLRLERFEGPKVSESIIRAMQDPEWQVRGFAIRASARKGIEIPEGMFDQETEPKVIRMAQRVGVALPKNLVRKMAEREMASRTPERVVMGIEIATRSGDEQLIAQAKKRLGQLLQHMNNTVLVTVGDRLADLLGISPAPSSVHAWQSRLASMGKTLKFPAFEPMNQAIMDEDYAPLAKMDSKAFVTAVDYFDQLHEQDLEIVIVIDATGSMGSVIYRAQAEANRLMLILNDLSNSMKMGVIVYRDEGDAPMLEATRLSHDTAKIRNFLFNVKAKGGGDTPEAMHEGLYVLTKMGFSSKATKRAVIITDAPAHEEHLPRIKKLATSMAKDGLTTHGLWVGASKEAQTHLTAVTGWGHGSIHALGASDDLGKMVVRFSIDEQLHESFDHLYDLYAGLGL